MSCPHCFKGGIHDHATPTGEMKTVHGVSCYVTRPASSSPTSKSQIIFLCDAFGLNLVNNKLLADRYASDTGMKVLVPEVIPGGGAPTNVLGLMDSMLKPVAWLDFWGQLARIWSFLNVMATMVPFMVRANAPKSYPPILAFARAVKKEVEAGGKLGACGFCWGAYASTRLCTETVVEGDAKSKRLIDAQFNAHPSRLKTPDMILDAVTTHKVPYSCAIGDNDMVWGVKSVYETQAALKEKVGEPEANDYEIRIYPGCTHGFNARAKPGDEVEIKACEDATRQAVDWWKKYL